MLVVFTLLLLFCFASLITGLIKPGLVLKWGEKKTRGKVLGYYGLGILLSLIFLGIYSDQSDTKETANSSIDKTKEVAQSQTSPNDSPKNEQQAVGENIEVRTSTPPKEGTEAVSMSEEESSFKQESGDLNWNKSEPDALLNGNVQLAVDMVKEMNPLTTGEAVSPIEVVKSPWNFYGKTLTFIGIVQDVTDFPPGSEDIRTADVLIQTTDGTFVEFFSTVSSGDIQTGNEVTLTGFPTGRMEVDNALGGTYTHLIMVTNKLK
ncbi:hypothetical protein HNR77_000118 [Paenibacillus sp. JGP012]|uniref:hypothetical protein n=1 Tax=Paenibacillus sp. JGP012 TaxID=2735914 RepID=UPI001615D54F|nr:hypothetical protein [Paenibacillus sp. JGP012]MBB6019061.1 hypothetical protein [Paenibacillus sp. JGP012]